MTNRLRHEARDTNGQGEKLVDFLSELDILPHDAIKPTIRKGEISVNRKIVKDVLFKLEAGSHVIAYRGRLLTRVTII